MRDRVYLLYDLSISTHTRDFDLFICVICRGKGGGGGREEEGRERGTRVSRVLQ